MAAPPAPTPAAASLALAQATPLAPHWLQRVGRWHEGLRQLGVRLPLFVVHDLGLALACPATQLVVRPLVAPDALGLAGAERATLAAWAALVAEFAAAATSDGGGALGDAAVTAALTRLVGDASAPDPQEDTEAPRLRWPDASERLAAARLTRRRLSLELRVAGALVEQRLRLLTRLDALDPSGLRLLGLMGAEAGAADVLDLLGVLGSPGASAVAEFALRLIPAILETRRRTGVSLVAAHGYAGLARRGALDSLVPSELAWDDQEFLRRLASDELLYFARESRPHEQGSVHHLVVDASASMRGERATFARATALALATELALAGDAVTLRFFDGRLHEPVPTARGSGGPRLSAAAVLGFAGELGRNPTRVFEELGEALEASDAGRAVHVHLFTHGACHVPAATVERLTRHARVTAVFLLPSGGALDLEWLPALAAHWVVDPTTLGSRPESLEAARGILAALSREPAAAAGSAG